MLLIVLGFIFLLFAGYFVHEFFTYQNPGAGFLIIPAMFCIAISFAMFLVWCIIHINISFSIV